jgi:putative DNA primase/helicase
MGAIMKSFANAQPVDFKAVSSAALSALDFVVPQLLPGGRRESGEWVARNPTRNDAKPGSFKVNLRSGVWCDFATGDKGGDVIDLKAYLDGKSKLEAARELATMLNVHSAGSTNLTGNVRDYQSKATANVAATPAEAGEPANVFPARTKPDEEGKPRFMVAGDEGPRPRENEKRRHIYKRGGVPVRIKIMTRGDQRAFNAYRVADADGRTGWQYRKPEGFKSVPYVAGDLDRSSTVFWPEGEKDVDFVGKRGGCAVTFGGVGDGLPAGCERYIAGKHLVILADNDDEGSEHAEAKAALAFGVAESVRLVRFPELEKKQDVSDWFDAGYSFQDLVERARTTEEWQPATEQLDQAEQHIHARAEKKSSLPVGYSFSDRGLMWSNPDDLDKPAILVAGHFDVMAETRDPDGASWGVLLHWKDHDGRDHQFALPRATLAGDGSEARRILMDGGFFISPSQTARNLFNSFLLQVRSPNRAGATQRVGWHGNSFVMPDDCFGADQRDLLLLQSASAHEHPFRQAGTLESWQQNVARYSVGNSRLVLALSAAFAGPLVGPVPQRAEASTSRGRRPPARARRCMSPAASGAAAIRMATSAPGAQRRTGWKAFRLRIVTRCCAWTSCPSWRRRMQERPPTCLLTVRANRAARATARHGGLPSGASCSCRRAKSGCPIKSPRMAAASA